MSLMKLTFICLMSCSVVSSREGGLQSSPLILNPFITQGMATTTLKEIHRFNKKVTLICWMEWHRGITAANSRHSCVHRHKDNLKGRKKRSLKDAAVSSSHPSSQDCSTRVKSGRHFQRKQKEI